MTSKALTLGVVSVALTAGTYFVLHKVAPQKHVEETQQQQGPSVDEVFGGSLNLAALDQEEAAPAPAPAEAAAEPAAEEAPAAEGAAAEAPAETAAGDVAVASAGDMDAALPADAAAAPSAAPAPVEAAPAAEPEPEPAPAPAPVAEAPKPKPAAKAPSKKSDSKKPLTPWWGAESPNHLSVVYAGSAAYKKAIVLMFSGSFDSTASADANIKIKDSSGNAVSGKWEIGASNARMLVFPVQKNGRYSVSIGAGLTDRNNRKLDKKLQGPVQVQ